MTEVTVETEEPSEPDTTIVVAPTVIVAPESESEPEPVVTACEHTATITELVERVTRLETVPEPEPVVVVEPEPEPEPVQEDEEPERGHWWHEPIVGN